MEISCREEGVVTIGRAEGQRNELFLVFSFSLSHVVLVSDPMLFTSHVFLVLALSLGLRNVTCGS
ncbi:hypothetical protein E2C01_017691 [Portunus trituberculatus]|uniref:Uncharacterized protein n=1 Tax=Portunus trituberculatus TaxID=210409 RepID=A0A5B7DUF3_PORTR|nr:hypothetical protein [Portunus trituberculatus]